MHFLQRVAGDDQEWIKCLEEAVVFKTPVALNQLFVILITEELLDNLTVSILGQFETSLTGRSQPPPFY